jgi:hypothetical protein
MTTAAPSIAAPLLSFTVPARAAATLEPWASLFDGHNKKTINDARKVAAVREPDEWQFAVTGNLLF